jgi:molybdate transport system substrate-binding protein
MALSLIRRRGARGAGAFACQPVLLPLAATLCALWLCVACARPPVQPRKVAIAAAADLKFAMEEVSLEFHRVHPDVELQTSFGSSGNFYAQLHNGAPFDVYLSADVEYPRKLLRDGIGAADSLFIYGVGRIVVWVPAASALAPAAALGDAGVRHIAIANPQHAPYGRAAEAALRSMGLYDGLQPKLVLGEDIAQTFEFVESGAADVGIVALSLALAPAARDKGRYWEIPLDAYPRIEQGGLLLKDSSDTRAVRAFLVSAGGRGILKRYGFYLPESR